MAVTLMDIQGICTCWGVGEKVAELSLERVELQMTGGCSGGGAQERSGLRNLKVRERWGLQLLFQSHQRGRAAWETPGQLTGAGPQHQQRDGNVEHAKSQKDSKERSFCRTFIISLLHLNLKSIRNILGIWFEVELSLMFFQMVN